MLRKKQPLQRSLSCNKPVYKKQKHCLMDDQGQLQQQNQLRHNERLQLSGCLSRYYQNAFAGSAFMNPLSKIQKQLQNNYYEVALY